VLVNDKEVVVHMDVPGVTRDQIEIELENDVLTVRGERAFPYGKEKGEGRAWQRIKRGFAASSAICASPRGSTPTRSKPRWPTER
jgi:HSP20 family molecular chaperone IbpA